MRGSSIVTDTVTIRRSLPYGAGSVCSAFASAEAKAVWAAGPTELDFRPGGLERWSADGREHVARYIDIVRDHRIAYVEERSIAGVRVGAALVTIILDDTEAGSDLTWMEQSTWFDPASVQDRCGAVGAMLDRLPSYVGRVRSTAEPIRVSRHVAAPADRVFATLADPRNHPGLDGSGMLRASEDARPIRAVGDTFTMRMRLERVGDYLILNKVVDLVPGRRIEWAPTPGEEAVADINGIGADQGYTWAYELMPDGDGTLVTEIFDASNADEGIRRAVDDGRSWVGSMTETLERLARLVEG